jgi:DNA-directed RNA polymerase specialized sigma24 family protein
MVERGSRGFEDFYQAERATLLRAVAFALGDVDLGAEVTDEAMARAYERWGDVGEMANPSGWVYRVAVNLAYNRTRRRALERRRPVPPDRDRPDVEGVAVAGLDDLQPRPVEELDPTAEVYRAAAAEVAISMGVGEPAPEVAQVVRADLDGDGLAEVLVMAEQHGQPGSSLAAPGDWSAAFVRRVVAGAVQTTVVESHLTTDVDAPLLPQYRVGAIADLNGDGRLEVVLNMSYYEGSETTIREVGADGNLREVLSAACGV